MGQYSRVMETLEKLNTEKLRRQEKIAEEMRRKQSAEMMRVVELERHRKVEMEARRRKNETRL
jgi:membrane protein involved in colicin uptake